MTDPVRTVEAVWRMESAQLVASLTRIVRDLGLAEEIAADVFVLALEQWPARGVPPNPGAWLMATAKHKAIDRIRREVARDEKYAVIARDLETTVDDEVVAVPDDVLALVFTACHPVLPRESRVALTLRVVAGLRTEEIARAFLAPSATIGQRISRAKRTLAEAHVPFEVPQEDELAATALGRARGGVPRLQRGLLGVIRATSGCGATSPTRRCGSVGCSPDCCPTSPRCTVCSR